MITDTRINSVGDTSSYVEQLSGSGASVAVVSDPLGSGDLVCRSILAPGDVRAELSLHTDREEFGQDIWYWFRILVIGELPENAVIMQVHEESDDDDYIAFPQFALLSSSGYLNVRTSYDANAVSLSSTLVTRNLFRIPLRALTGKWVDFDLHVNWYWDNTAFTELYLNRHRIFREVGPNAINNDAARGGGDPYFKCGVYAINGSASGPCLVYHSGVVRGDNTYANLTSFRSAAGSEDEEVERLSFNSMSCG